MENKQCTRCKEVKEASTEFFNRNSLTPSGYSGWCKICLKSRRDPNFVGVRELQRREKADFELRGVKRCSKCQEVKELSHFHTNKSMKSGYTNNCKPCHLIYLRERRAQSLDNCLEQDRKIREARESSEPERVYQQRRNTHLVYTFKITLDEYEQMVVAQNNQCAICKVDFSLLNKNPAVDHDHLCCPGSRSCGKCVRGLLCSKCNTGLGSFKDEISLLVVAQSYLLDHKEKLSR